MSTRKTKRASRVVALAIAATVAVALIAPAAARGAPSVRGFSNGTITLAGMGYAANFDPDGTIGATARFKRFNDTNEMKGIKISYKEFADDNQDPAKSLNEARRLVQQVGVFAIVPNLSDTNPGAFLKQQHVPYFGFAFDNSYCSPKPDKTIYGFGYNGCLVPSNPSVMPDAGKNPYTYVSQKTGKKSPTLAIFSNDSESGKNSVKFQQIAYKGAGFDVVATNTQMPLPPVSDYTPYAQAMLTADNGKPPDAIVCLLSTDCISMWNLIKANGYTGTYFSSLYADVLVKAMNGSVSSTLYTPVDQSTPGMEQLKKDVDAIQPGSSSKIDTGMMAGYLSTDMFITALKTAAKKGKSGITPENVQKAAMNQTWQLEGVAGPTIYPTATMASYASCNALVLSDGTAWKQVVPFTCSKKLYPVK